MKKLKTALTILVSVILTALAPSALADAAVDPIDFIMYDLSWVLYLFIGVGTIALAVLIFTIVKMRRNRR